MTIILKDIDVKKRTPNNYEQNKCEMYDMEKYIDIAKRCISLFAGSPSSSRMINDEDAISHVAEHIMWGHLRWKEDGGRTLKSYLNQCAIWAIKVWKTKIYNSDSKKILSLNHTADGDGSKETQQYENVADKKLEEPFQILYDNKIKEAKSIIDNSCLTKLQNTCLKQRYIEGKKLQEIADDIGVTRQAVNQHIKKAIKKLRRHNGICE